MMITVKPTSSDIALALVNTIKFEIDRMFGFWDVTPAYFKAFRYVSEQSLQYDSLLDVDHILELTDYCHQRYVYYRDLEEHNN